MGKMFRVGVIILCAAVLIITWVVVVTSKTIAEKQYDLIQQAERLTNDGIYILAVPLLEEAIGYDSNYTDKAEHDLKQVYLALIDQIGFSRKYLDLLSKQMSRSDVSAEVFAEAAHYHLGKNAISDGLEVLRTGIERTSDPELTAMYELNRYAFETGHNTYEEVTAIYDLTLQVKIDEKWGIVGVDGAVIIPCEYDKISTFSQNQAIVKKDDLIYAVDADNNRIALASSDTIDFRNFSQNRTALLTGDGWRRATGSFELSTNVFEDIAMHSEGFVAAKTDGKWGVVSIDGEWLIEAEYDEVIVDKLGRCVGQGAAFVRKGEYVLLYSNGEIKNSTYQDAHPFSSQGYAAVKRDGKWGFIDTDGNVKIKFIYDDALSFGGHLAAVKTDDMWGYISLSGEMVIDAIYELAESFAGGSAPVLTDRGWRIITLIEFKKERTL